MFTYATPVETVTLQVMKYRDSLALLGTSLELLGKLALEGCSQLDKESSSELELTPAGGCSSSLLL
jgi:hypothetical protein